MKLYGFDAAHAMYKLRLLSTTDLPQIAADALEEGYDSLSLRILAGNVDDCRNDKLFSDTYMNSASRL
ncbi:MAG TPA: hypothetical protein VF135_10265 [Terriglobales bacterium]